jgi:hypothetical protein
MQAFLGREAAFCRGTARAIIVTRSSLKTEAFPTLQPVSTGLVCG